MEEGLSVVDSTVLFAVFAGACLLLLMYIIKLLNADHKDTDRLKNEKTEHVEKKKEAASKGKKKASESRWTGRSDKQGFTHPWLLTSLKGHTSQVLDMDFSSNGKYLASCGEEDPDPGGDLTPEESTDDKHSESNPESSLPSSANPSPRTKGLSRRQRKNRRREDLSPPETKKKSRNSRKFACTPLKYYLKLDLSQRNLARLLGTYLLSPEQMLSLSYPVEHDGYSGRVVIFKSDPTQNYYPTRKFNVTESKFDVNAQEFVPGIDYAEIKAEWNANHDSGQGSGSSSDSGEALDDTASSSSTDYEEKAVDLQIYSIPNQENEVPADGEVHRCVRCRENFYVKDNEYVTLDRCVYHWGKLNFTGSKYRSFGRLYTCCYGEPGSPGCVTARRHVWNGIEPGVNGPFDSYVYTRHRKTPPQDGDFGVYALDCEMCYTVAGLELTKVTVVGTDGRLVYDSFVRPDHEIVDYNTRFSGITPRDLRKNTVKSLREVQNDLMGFINANTILIGHGLENDLRALHIMHYTCVDTAVTFPHFYGFPFRRSLKSLAANILGRQIQVSPNGHNSFEDARTCMELMLWRVRTEFGSLLEHYQRQHQHQQQRQKQ